MIYVFLADGFEEMEALAPVDLLRRAGLSVQTVGVDTETPVGAHGIPVVADIDEGRVQLAEMTALILPGGMPGTTNLRYSRTVQQAIQTAMERQLPIAAICAAPSVLGEAGVLKGKKATCFPGFEEALTEAEVVDTPVVRDGKIVTAKGAGAAIEFALELVAQHASPELAATLRKEIQCP